MSIRNYCIDLRDTSLPERIKLKELLEARGEPIYSHTKLATSNRYLYDYYLYSYISQDWNGGNIAAGNLIPIHKACQILKPPLQFRRRSHERT